MKKLPSGFFIFSEFLILLMLGLFSLYFFIEISEEIAERSMVTAIDNRIIKLIQTGKFPFLQSVCITITNFGNWQNIAFQSALISIFLLYKRLYFYSVINFIVTAGSISANAILKNIFNRPRPAGMHIVETISSSFPSGHAMNSISFYGFLIYLTWKVLKTLKIKLFISLILLMLIFLFGFSRVYLKVHYPSDVAGGYSAGLFWLVFSIGIAELLYYFAGLPRAKKDKSQYNQQLK